MISETRKLLDKYRQLKADEERYAEVGDVSNLTSTSMKLEDVYFRLEAKSL